MKAKVSGTKKKINGTTFLLMITILLFVVMYAAGMIVFNDKGFAKPQMFLNLYVWLLQTRWKITAQALIPHFLWHW